MTAVDVAVVIVTYRTAQLCVDALRSLHAERAASALNIRAIVVDNDSGDLPAITEAVESHAWSSWVTLVPAPRNGGFAYGNNLGIARAYAMRAPSYIYLLNPDAQLRPGALVALVDFLERHSDAHIAGSSFENIDGSEWPIAFRFPSLLGELNIALEIGIVARLLKRWVVPMRMSNEAQKVDWICGASMLIRPAVLEAVGGMDENYFLYFEETDFCRRARGAGYTTWYVPESRVMHIAGQSTHVTGSSDRARRLPRYWYESRRRYFAVTYGVRRAIFIDILVLFGYAVGTLKRSLLRRSRVPYLMRDLVSNSIIWPRNRAVAAARTFSPDRCA